MTVTQLTSGMSGADATAYAGGYTAKVTAGSDTNYIKNIENINVQIWNDANSNGQKDWGSEVTFGKNINLAVSVYENIAPSQYTLASVTGTFMADTVDLSTGSPLISSALVTGMTTYGRGINADMTAGGGDTVTGSGYGDTVAFGNGINYADGGANAGSPPSGGAASDSLQVFVAVRWR